MVIMCLCENTSDIWPMLQFSKSKTTDIFVLNSSFNILSMLLCPQIEDSFHVQKPMNTVFYWKSCIIVDVCTADHTQFIGIFQILVIREINKSFGIEQFFCWVQSHVWSISLSQMIMLEDLRIVFNNFQSF